MVASPDAPIVACLVLCRHLSGVLTALCRSVRGNRTCVDNDGGIRCRPTGTGAYRLSLLS